MPWVKAKLQGAETDRSSSPPPEPLFGYETLLSGVSVLTPNEQSKHRYTCTVNTFTHCWFAIIDTHSSNKTALAVHKGKQQFVEENCLSLRCYLTTQKEQESFKSSPKKNKVRAKEHKRSAIQKREGY